MEKARIAELLAPFLSSRLTEEQLGQVSAHLDLLVKWNAKTNLTAVRDPEQMVARHFGESFFAAEHLLLERVETAIDLGSGAGFPGMPLAIFAPQTRVTLIESQNKKATFLKEVVRTLALKNVDVFYGRGEDFLGTAELVTMRAVEKFLDSLEIAMGLTKPRARLGALIGEQFIGDTIDRAMSGGFFVEHMFQIPGSSQRQLLVFTNDPIPLTAK